MERVLDQLNDRIWHSIAWQNENSGGSYNHWDEEWERMWTSEWNYDDIHLWYDTKWEVWVWTDGIKGNPLV
jgi:hypothetical protein